MNKLINLKKYRKIRRAKPKILSIERLELAFIEIPKVASRSLNRAMLSVYTNQDSTIFDKPKVNLLTDEISEHLSLKKIQQKYRDFYIFSFVRDPYARIISCYKNKVKNKPDDDDYFGYCGIKSTDDFETFLNKVVDIPDHEADRHFRSQSWFLCDQDKPTPDFIGKLENLNNDWSILQDRFSLPDIPHFNPTGKQAFELSSEMKKLIYKRYEKDFENFSYRS
ncbi:sulfotransferase family protein [Lentisphaera marina]|uniref:sulfotransferase family protein n=1 Tax=Lentisphaera marina TaxID=1111041 RepID=UPI0023656992|nr:sulfotransferase family protein [Lentisphaera marina]MDD7985952.1 sulfotransferase family protein [Lentisphaera marina]